MKYSEIKRLATLCDDWRNAANHIKARSCNFWIGETRFVAASEIDQIMQEELAADTYALGCFGDWFLAGVLGVEVDAIEALQKAGCYEALGGLVISLGKLETLQQEYARLDGYGHHFNNWDGSEITECFNGVEYYIFNERES